MGDDKHTEHKLADGDYLEDGYDGASKDVLTSDNGEYKMSIDRDSGQLVLTGPGGVTMWSSEIEDRSALDDNKDYIATFEDGKLALWGVDTMFDDEVMSIDMNGADTVEITDDGRLVGMKDGKEVWELPQEEYTHWPKELKIPYPSGASTAVELAIDAANQHVRYLVTQIGSGNAELPDMGGDGGFLSDADITALAGKSGDDYQDALTEITLEADGYEDLDKDFFKDVSTLMKEHKGTYKCIKDAVDGFSEAVKELGSIKDGKQDEAVLGYLDTSVTGVKKAVQGYNEMFGDKDDGADDEEKKDDEDTEDDDKEDTEDDDTKDDDTKDDEETTEDEGGGDDGGDSEDSGDSGASNDYQGSPVYDPSTGTTDYSDQYKDIIGADTGKENADATAPSTEDAKDDAISSVLESLGSPASAAAPVSAPASAPSGGVGDLASLLGPMAAMNSMAAAQQQDRAHQADHRRTAAEDDAAASWPAPADPAAQPGNPPNVTAPAIAGPPAAPAVPGRSVDISLPDGSTARASAVAADAVHREMNNHNGSDAKAAYAGTVAESTSQHPWAPVDAGKLATGDVVQWANRTALVVVTPQGPRYLEGGRLVVLNPAAMDHDGTFQGFFHPTGADARAPEPAV